MLENLKELYGFGFVKKAMLLAVGGKHNILYVGLYDDKNNTDRCQYIVGKTKELFVRYWGELTITVNSVDYCTCGRNRLCPYRRLCQCNSERIKMHILNNVLPLATCSPLIKHVDYGSDYDDKTSDEAFMKDIQSIRSVIESYKCVPMDRGSNQDVMNWLLGNYYKTRDVSYIVGVARTIAARHQQGVIGCDSLWDARNYRESIVNIRQGSWGF